MARPKISLQSLMERNHLSPDQLEEEVSDEHLSEVSEIIEDHEIVGPALGLTKAEMIAIDRNRPTHQLKKKEMLDQWKEIYACTATYRVLIEALLKCRKAGHAQKVCKLLPPSLSPSAEPVHPTVTKMELMGSGKWPAPIAPPDQSHPDIPAPPEEDTDTSRKVYKMSSKPRGLAIVINNKNFTCGMPDRVGTDRDAENLTKLLIWLGFVTNRFDNLTGKKMRYKLEDLSSRNHAPYDAVVVCLLTHGINGELYGTDGGRIPINAITSYFDGNNCPTLINKPKVFIIQTCRGEKYDYGVESESTDAPTNPPSEEEQKEEIERQVVKKALDADETDGEGYSKEALPTEADFILAYATVHGYVAWRNSERGSWFIEAFVDAMFELAKTEHFIDILTEVNRRVAHNFQNKDGNKQIPAPVTMLTRRLYFKPIGDK